jgi:hypothetical protein
VTVPFTVTNWSRLTGQEWWAESVAAENNASMARTCTNDAFMVAPSLERDSRTDAAVEG